MSNDCPVGYTDETKELRIRELQDKKVDLLSKYGVFGGGPDATRMHLMINAELERLGIDPNS